jgi:hypothetical protein
MKGVIAARCLHGLHFAQDLSGLVIEDLDQKLECGAPRSLLIALLSISLIWRDNDTPLHTNPFFRTSGIACNACDASYGRIMQRGAAMLRYDNW